MRELLDVLILRYEAPGVLVEPGHVITLVEDGEARPEAWVVISCRRQRTRPHIWLVVVDRTTPPEPGADGHRCHIGGDWRPQRRRGPQIGSQPG